MIGVLPRSMLLAISVVALPSAALVDIAVAQSNLNPCPQSPDAERHDCFGIWSDGKGYTYEGEWQDDTENGWGTATFTNGKYVGEFKDGRANGRGTLTFANGDKYSGEFKDYRFNGTFSVTYANGDIFTGRYVEEQRNGQGTYVWKDGSTYSGQWKDGVPFGEGTHNMPNGTILTRTTYGTKAEYDTEGAMEISDVLTYSGGAIFRRTIPQ